MGWDAYSEPFNTNWGFEDPNEGDRAWDPVVADLRSRNLMIDGLLAHGGLDVSTCGLMLERATRRSVYGDPWTAEEVKRLASEADWSFLVRPEHEWAKESAKAFLNHCAVLGRSIRFSW